MISRQSLIVSIPEIIFSLNSCLSLWYPTAKLFEIKFNSLGGQIVELSLKDFTNHKGDSLYIIKNNNNFNVEFKTKDGRSFNSSDFIFEPELSTKNFKQVVTYRAKIGQNKNIEFIYELSADDFMINFRIVIHTIGFYYT